MQKKKKPVNPYQVLYFNPSIHAVKFAKMAEKWHNKKDLEILQKVADITGFILIESSKLNWRQRDKFRELKFKIGYYTYYLIPPGAIDIDKFRRKEELDLCENM